MLTLSINDLPPLFIFGTILLVLLSLSLVALFVLAKQKQNNFRIRQKATELLHEHQLLQAKLDVQEQSLKIISQEIHDNIGQTLSFVRMKIYGAQQGIPEGSAREKLNTAKEMIDHSIQDLRNISHSLNSEWVKKQGLSQAIIKHLEQITERDGMKFNVEVNGDDSLAPEQEVVVFRIVQEAVKNTLTHAQATEINFDISYEHDIFRLEIIDNGIGFNADLTNDSTGIGLTNMQERARILGGEMHFNTKPGEGTKIVLTINQSKA